MYTINITENSDRSLPTISVGRASAFMARVVGVPPEYSNVQLSFGVPNATTANAIGCDAVPGGEWKVYASGVYFATAGKTKYHVTARTPNGDSIYLGGGTMFVRESVLNVAQGSLPVLPDDVYVRGANGLYYKVTAALDEDGVPYMVVDTQGVER